ncbi:autotransporter assembly complex protein TamA [Biostraticola tofi]|uniref:Translocation and assembly module subunit TamA n=1 Tax=Biostraticola tofi TaxID=466109 RepID=A0A4R3Z4V8_9GAMM|nr:autotransporter assembly complex family protein [Biostraticola tofi]TCV99019.1 autotransporter secretion outer membrane protein TamA [Biostraticola tofi]
MRYLRLLCLLGTLVLTPVSQGASIRLQVEGISGELQRNVRARLSTISTDEITADARFQARVNEAVREGLSALGYYSPVIDFQFRPAVNGGREVLVTRINPGKPVLIAGVDVILRGDARQDPDYRQRVKDGKPALGTVLNHADYTNFKNGLSSLALRKGYFDAEFRKSQLGVSPTRYQAFWDIDFDSGQRYRFGKIRFHGAQIREDYLQNLSSIREGEEYSADSLAELNRRLAATNWFNSVVISPDFEQSKTNKTLPLDAVVTPRTRNTIETGVGYATDVGPRVKTSWSRPWINSRGHSLETSLSLSAPEQALDFSYKIPLLKNPLEQYYLVQSGFKREDLNDTQSNSTSVNVARYWDMSSGWQRSVNLRWSLDHFTQADVTNTTMLLYPGVSINRTRQRGGLMPTWGDSQRYSFDVSDTTWGSDIDFFVIQAQNVWIRTLADKHRFVARGNLGWIETNDFERVPPSLRFFAGGDRSIRGYKYKSLSPKDDKDKLTGASKLATGSLEYQYNVSGKWWGAAFIDAGEAVNDIKQSNVKTGAGVGVRWQSPVGPIKLDIAAPVGDKDEHGLQFYIGLGPEL